MQTSIQGVRRLFSAETIALVEWGGQDNAALERLVAASLRALKREMTLLTHATERGDHAGLWAAMHMMRTQNDTFNMAAFSESTRLTVARVMSTQRGSLAGAAQELALAGAVSRALSEMIATFESAARE